MRHVKRYQELFETQTDLTPEQTEWLDKCTDGTWTLNPQTGLVDVSGSFSCSGRNLVDFRGVRFGVVGGNFYFDNNKLTSLEGAPQEVEGGFSCDNNKLTSLKGAPQTVGGDFDCYNNKLTSLKGAPMRVGGSFNCPNNNLTSLEGAPQKVGGSFDCSNNNLTSLEGAPASVRWGFFCPGNPVSEPVLSGIYNKMLSGMSWTEALTRYWEEIDNADDLVLLAPMNSDLSQEEVEGYQVLAKMKRRVI